MLKPLRKGFNRKRRAEMHTTLVVISINPNFSILYTAWFMNALSARRYNPGFALYDTELFLNLAFASLMSPVGPEPGGCKRVCEA